MPRTIEEELIARINNVHNRVLMRKELKEKPLGYEILVKIDHFGTFIKNNKYKFDDQQLSEINILFKHGEIMDNMIDDSGFKKNQATQLDELELLKALYNQTVKYYASFYDYNPNSSLQEENPTKTAYLNAIKSAQNIKNTLYKFQHIALNNKDLQDVVRKNSIYEFKELINYTDKIIRCIEEKMNKLSGNESDLLYLDRVNKIINDFINALNNSNELFEIQVNTYKVKYDIFLLEKEQEMSR